MRFSWTNVGYAMAVFAAIFGLGTTIWPMTPQAREFGSSAWLVLSIGTALGFFVAAIVADRHTGLARVLLVGGALLRIGSSIFFGRFAEMNLVAIFFDLVPALLAIAAGLLIGPIRRRAFP